MRFLLLKKLKIKIMKYFFGKHHIEQVKEKINKYKNSVSDTNKQKIKKDMMKIKHDIEKIMKKSKK